MRILFLSTWFPYPPTNGSKQRAFNLLRCLAAQHEVTLLSFADGPQSDPRPPALTALCRGLEVVPLKPFAPRSWRALRGYLGTVPRSIVDTYSAEMTRRIVALLARQRCDFVIAAQLPAAAHVDDWAGLPALYEEVELGVLYEQFIHAPTILHRARHALTWWKHRRHLSRLLAGYRGCTVVSAREQYLLAKAVPQHPPIAVIPNGIDLADYAGVRLTPQRNHLIFSGSFRYIANHDAMCWFVREVYPLIRTRVPDVQLTITGAAADRLLPAAPNVMHTGHLEDVRPLIASSWISLAPMRSGGGTRLKILEAMALGTPVVATSKGAEGLEVSADTHLLIADTPQQFAEHVVRLLRDADLRRRLSQCARELVATRYNWNVIGPRFAQLVAETAGRGAAA